MLRAPWRRRAGAVISSRLKTPTSTQRGAANVASAERLLRCVSRRKQLARGLNKVQVIGNLGDDPEVRYTPSGVAVATMRIACNEQWTDRSGEKKESVEWVTLVAWDKLAEIAAEYLGKVSQIYAEGKLKTEKWQDKNGQDRYTTKVQISQLLMLGGSKDRGDGQRQAGAGDSRRAKDGGRVAAPASQASANFDDDIPF
jgi:single-strand DNA-binding protein